ncbi:MAG: hypothetical protein HYW63_00170 [Candidatus Levybacteria bacterium]|nr:hypothetical protein [Candidatus Levybacteria bacterium]
MRKTALFLILFLFIVPPAFAESKASVKIKNNVSSSSISEVKSSTDIRIETNGNVTSYSTKEPGNIEINANNGSSEIKVNGNVVSQNSASPTATKSPTPTPSDENRQNDNKNIFEFFESLFKIFFSLLV